MSMIDIDFVPSLPRLANGFFQLADDVTVRSLAEPLKKSIKEVAAPAFRSNFVEGGDPPWEPWAESTGLHRDSRKLMRRSGALMRRAGSVRLWNIDGSQGQARAENLTGVEYGGIHQEGAPSVNIPARPWATLSERDLEKIQNVFGVWVDVKIQQHIMALV